ncbi:aminoimidazole riboside kinase [Bacillus sp. HMF5848]|uniref:aminoimidazole riboside kinase n=1 Tax=Bacillus sp. HMF5848 TaxID=2495421 RepID=UPI0026BCA1F8
MKGIICLGEALIDFVPLDMDNISYQKSPGGAPANVAVGAAKLGANSAFVGTVGADVMGEFLYDTLAQYNVNVEKMNKVTTHQTNLVFVKNDTNGERSFSFYIPNSADQQLSENDINEDFFKKYKIVHYGSISLIHEPIHNAHLKAIQVAKQHGLICSYDPNLRMSLWKDEGHAKETILSIMPEADVLKVSEEELAFLTGETDIPRGIEALSQYNISVILVTLGSEGSYVSTKGEIRHVPARKVKAVDTTGAGDAFMSGILYNINEYNKPIEQITIDELVEFAKFASVSGALAASTKGAMTALPSINEVQNQLNM